MTARPRVGVMGAGSIGCYVGGRLVTAGAADVVFVGRERLQRELAEHGLEVRDFDRPGTRVAGDRLEVVTEPQLLASCDVVLCCVKSAHTDGVASTLATVLAPDAVVVSLQNGVRNPKVLRDHLPDHRVLAAIVDFNVVSRGDGVFHRTTSGPLVVETCDDPRWRGAVDALRAGGVDVVEHDDIAPHQWTKLLVNLSNAVSALSGAPTREIVATAAYRRVVAALTAEGIRVLRAAGIRPARLRGIPVGLMPRVLRLPTPLVKLVLRAQMRIDPQARSSMWEDLSRGRATEVDYLNGQIVALADDAGVDAPLNRRVVDLVHAAERAGRGSPQLSADALWSALSAPSR